MAQCVPKAVATALLCLLTAGGCADQRRYNVETEVVFDIDGRRLTSVNVTRCHVRDLPGPFEHSVIGLTDSVSVSGEPLWFPIAERGVGIISFPGRCWSPEDRPRKGDHREVTDEFRHAYLRVFDDRETPTIIDTYSMPDESDTIGPLKPVRADTRVTRGKLTTEIERGFPAVAGFGTRDQMGRGTYTRFAGISGQRRANAETWDFEDVLFERVEPDGPFTPMDEPPSGLRIRMYREGEMSQPHQPLAQWRPEVCVEGQCVVVHTTATIETPSGAIYHLYAKAYNLTVDDFMVRRGPSARSYNGTSEMVAPGCGVPC